MNQDKQQTKINDDDDKRKTDKKNGEAKAKNDESQKAKVTNKDASKQQSSSKSGSSVSSLSSPKSYLGHESSVTSTKTCSETTSKSLIQLPEQQQVVFGHEQKRLRIRQPFKILTDIWGVLTSYKFRTKLYVYLEDNLKGYLLHHFDDALVREYIGTIVKRTREERTKWSTMPPLAIDWPPPKDTRMDADTKSLIVEAVFANWLYRRQHKKEACLSKGLDTLNGHIWLEGYREKRLRPHIFPDVLPNFRKWHSDPLYIKIYTFATGPPENQKLFLSASSAGDVSEYVTSYFDTCGSYKYDWSRYRQVASGLNERVIKNLFYLTDSPRKGDEARKAGLTVFIVARDGNKKYRQSLLDKFDVIHTFDQFDFYEFDSN